METVLGKITIGVFDLFLAKGELCKYDNLFGLRCSVKVINSFSIVSARGPSLLGEIRLIFVS